MNLPVRPQIVPSHSVAERRGCVAILSSLTREGDWELPRFFRIFSFMGNAVLDLTSARIGSEVSEIEVRAFMAGVEILVPPGVRVDCDGSPFLASFEVEREFRGLPPADAPLIRITGSATFATVTVKIVDPNAPGWVEKMRKQLLG